MSEKRVAPPDGGSGDLVLIQRHLENLSAGEILEELDARMEEMTDQSCDPELIRLYLDVLEEKEPLGLELDPEASLQRFLEERAGEESCRAEGSHSDTASAPQVPQAGGPARPAAPVRTFSMSSRIFLSLIFRASQSQPLGFGWCFTRCPCSQFFQHSANVSCATSSARPISPSLRAE